MSPNPFARPSPWTYGPDRCEDCNGIIGAAHEDRCGCDPLTALLEWAKAYPEADALVADVEEARS